MATVTLGEVWLHLVSDLSQNAQLDVFLYNETDSEPGYVREGTTSLRFVTAGVDRGSHNISAELVSRSDADLLRTFKGKPLMLRDALGRKIFGVVQSFMFDETAQADAVNYVGVVTFVFEETSGSEEV